MSDLPLAAEKSDDLIVECVTNDDPRARALGRLLATNMDEVFRDFVNAELERGTTHDSMLQAMEMFFAGLVNSYIAMLEPSACRPELARRFGTNFKETLVERLPAIERLRAKIDAPARAGD